jgi:site-specific DNA-methyltransferase (adenine-specific)
MREVKMATWEVINGDCLDVLPTLADESVAMIWTDPPFGHSNADGDLLSRRAEAVGDGRASPQVAIANDDQEAMRRVVDGMLNEAARVLVRDCCCCCCCCCGGGGPSPTFAWVANRMDADGMRFFHSVIWDKRNPGMGWRYRRQHEMVMVAHRRGGKLAWADDAKAQPNIISMSKPRDANHPNEKPVDLVRIFIENHTKPGDTVLDPFCGSGTTGVACMQTGRNFIGIELDARYCDIARRRITEAANHLYAEVKA